MAGSGQSARGGHRRKLHKCLASNHLRVDAEQAREEPWRTDARLLRSDLALAGYAKCNERQCKVQDFTSCTPQARKVALNMNGSPDTHSKIIRYQNATLVPHEVETRSEEHT